MVISGGDIFSRCDSARSGECGLNGEKEKGEKKEKKLFLGFKTRHCFLCPHLEGFSVGVEGSGGRDNKPGGLNAGEE
jgi:hypothetical protein